MLPQALVVLYGDALSAEAVAAARSAGATPRTMKGANRKALIRQMFAEIEADIYILAHGADGTDICVAPLIVAEIDGAGKDFVTVSRLSHRPSRDSGDHLLAWTVDFLFGQGGDAITSEFKACSRRFARSYGRGAGDVSSALDLTLHALRLRMPVGEVAALGRSHPSPARPKARDLASWIALLRLVGHLLIEERPRRVFGVAGLALMAAGIATALPALTIHDWEATLPHGVATAFALGLMVCGSALGALGLLLDTLAKARQEVKRLGYLAIPRRADPV